MYISDKMVLFCFMPHQNIYKNPIPATGYYVCNSKNITINLFLVIIIESEIKELWPRNQAAFRISDRLHTVSLYSIAQLGCETGLSVDFKMVEISTDHMSQNELQLSDLLGLFHTT